MPSPKRDKYKPGSGKILDEDDAVFDLTAWFKSILSGQDTLGISDTSDTRIDPGTKDKQEEMITLLTDFVADETNVVSEFLKNGSNENQNVDGSSTPVTFSTTQVPVGKKFICSRVLIYMEDSTAFTSAIFAGIPALTNGWQLAFNGVTAFTAKDNKTLAIFMFDLTGNELFGKTNQTMIGRFSFNKFTDGADGITIREGETLDTIVNDNLTGLDYLHVMAQGVYKDA